MTNLSAEIYRPLHPERQSFTQPTNEQSNAIASNVNALKEGCDRLSDFDLDVIVLNNGMVVKTTFADGRSQHAFDYAIAQGATIRHRGFIMLTDNRLFNPISHQQVETIIRSAVDSIPLIPS